MALHDDLTGLANRGLFADRLQQDLCRAERENVALAVLCLDLDRFKQVNDTLGHPVGDALLRAVVDRLRSCVRRSDTVARLGGDEFAIIQFPITRQEEAGSFAERVIAALSEPYHQGEHRIMIGTSAGIAVTPNDSFKADGLLKMADIALYRAKADGRGTSRFFKPEMDQDLQIRQSQEKDLRRAIAINEIGLHYQPLIDAQTVFVTSVEALIRWRHPERGLVNPDALIPLAKETGLILQIGSFVVRQACREVAGWPASVRIAVNISATGFKSAGLVETIVHALRDTGLAADRLELEITETSLLTDTGATLTSLDTLRTVGIRIVLDDFGAGYSSLSYLRTFKFDKIKIDRTFVKDITTRADCRAIVRAVTSIGASLGIATTAEGVETAEQLEHVRVQGCSQIQGFLFAGAVPASEIPGLLKQTIGFHLGPKPDLSPDLTPAQAPQPCSPALLLSPAILLLEEPAYTR